MLLQIILLCLLGLLLFFLSGKKTLPAIDRRLRMMAIINSGILSLAAANRIWQYLKEIPEVFPDLIGGFLAISSLPKSFEYYTFYSGIALFVLLFVLLTKLYSTFTHENEVTEVYNVSLYSLITPVIMAGQSFISGLFTVSFIISAISVFSGLLVITLKLRYRNLHQREMNSLLLALYFGLASHLCIELFCNRTALPGYTVYLYWTCWVIFLLLAIRRGWWNRLLVISQTGLPLAFGNLLMPTQILQNGKVFDPGFNEKLNIAVLVLILLGYLMLYRAFRINTGRLNKFIPSLPLAGLLCLFCAVPDQWGNLSFDDYHNGELVLPWFLLQKFDCHMYVDYVPSRGIVNYIPGFLLWFFKGHDFSFIHRFIKWADLPLYLMALSILRRRCGLLIAFAGCAGIAVLTPNIGAGLLVGLCAWVWFSSPEWRKQPTFMLLAFFITGLLGVLYSLTDTMAVFVAMIPMAFYMLFLAWQHERKKLLAALGGIILCMAILLLIPLCRNIFTGIMNVLFMQTDTYTTAHCVPLLKHNITHYTIYYITLTYGFLLLTALFAIRLFFRRKNDDIKENIHYFATVSLVILGVILIQRALGRTSCETFSRGAAATMLMLIFALPVWFADWQNKRLKICHVMILCLLFGACGNYAERLYELNEKVKGVVFEPSNTVNPASAGLPHLGSNTVLQAEHFKHHCEVKSLILSILPKAESNGGFWDMTNNSTIYAYCGNGIRPPMSYPAYFYVASPQLARKMQQEIAAAAPLLVLIKGKNIEFYEGPPALRSYPLYKYLLENYRVFADIYGKTWMIRKEHENLLTRSALVKQESLGDQQLLSEALDYKTIDGYPRSWGASMDTLQNKLREPLTLQAEQMDANHIVLHSTVSLNGDFLYLRFNRPVISKMITVFWQDDFNGKGQPYLPFWGGTREYLIPLSASTNWFMSENKSNMVIRHEDQLPEMLTLEEAIIYKRAK